MANYTVIIERGVDGTYSAYIADNNCEFGCIGEGNTVDETKADFLQAVEDMKAVYAEEGATFPEVEFTFTYDMASFLSYYAYAFTLAGLARITGVNQGQLSHYVTGHRNHPKQPLKRLRKRCMLSETKSVKSNLHKPTINKVPPLSGIFYFPSVVQGTETSPLLPNNRVPFRFCERASKNGMGSRPT